LRPNQDLQQHPPAGEPNFICFGMQKAGTRWLFDQMNGRKDVWMPPIKEINFFYGKPLKPVNRRIVEIRMGSMPIVSRPNDPERSNAFLEHFSIYDPKNSNIDWYRKLFSKYDERVSGDISPGYAVLSPDNIKTMEGTFPKVKYIFLIRNPVDRFWSSICMSIRKGKIAHGAVADWRQLQATKKFRFLETQSMPSKIWNKWSAIVPAERIRYWFFDDIVNKPELVIDEICEYLEIEKGSGALPANYNRKKKQQKIPMPPEFRLKLCELFREEIERCVQMFGGPAAAWRERAGGHGHVKNG
jgi:Sulfotransferase family